MSVTDDLTANMLPAELVARLKDAEQALREADEIYDGLWLGTESKATLLTFGRVFAEIEHAKTLLHSIIFRGQLIEQRRADQ